MGNPVSHSVMVKTKDISIGQEKWITWIEIGIDHTDSFDIDSLLKQTKKFWQNLETECVAECCGIYAFALWPDDIKNASKEFDIEDLKNQLLNLRSEALKSNNRIVISKRMNNLFDNKVFVEMIDHILSCL